MQIHELTALARNSKASDIHISEGLPLMFRIDGHLAEAPVQLSAAETRSLILSLMDEAHREAITSERIDADFALVAPDGTRSRVNVFYQQGRAAATLRLLNDSIPTLEELAMPPVLTKLADEPRGLILVTGPTGSGKSTTLAAMIDHINKTRSDHIITIEDPIEYVYQGRCSLIHQREVGADVRSFASALRSALREDPDVILVGEMRDYSLINRAYCIRNPKHYTGFGPDCWGLTASYSVNGYAAHAPNEKEDLGVISPTAALSSIVYTPEYSLQVMRHLYGMGEKVFGPYGFYDAFSETDNWYPKRYLAIDQGPIAVMIENYRSGLLWKLFMSHPDVQNGLNKLGFTYTK